MLDRKLIQKEFGFLGDDIFLNVSQVCMPAKRVQEAYGSFMDDYVRKFGEGVVDEAWSIVNGCRPKLQKLINAKEAHEIGMQLAKEILGGKYEFVLTTHIDKGHIHNVRPDRAMRKAV